MAAAAVVVREGLDDELTFDFLHSEEFWRVLQS